MNEMTPPRTLRRLSRFWRRAFLFALAVQVSTLIVPLLTGSETTAMLPFLMAAALSFACLNKRDAWTNERRAYLSNRKRFRRFAR